MSRTPKEVLAKVRQIAEAERPDPLPPPVPPDLASICMRMPGRYLRLPLGYAPLDDAMRGGIRTANLTIVGGPPGGHKTSILTRAAYLWARDGVRTHKGVEPVLVSVVAGDESRDGFLSRIGQVEHVSRDDLDHEDAMVSRPAWSVVSHRIAAVAERLTIWDPREERCTVEGAAEELASRASPATRRVLVVDSVQSPIGWACDVASDDSPRIRIDRRLATCMRIARSTGLCVILTSELARAGYRAKAGNQEVTAMATLKESGGLEYSADQVLILSRLEGEAPRIRVEVAKTRWGETGAVVHLRRDGWLTYVAEDVPDELDVAEARQQAKDAEARAKHLRAAAALAATLAERPGLTEGDTRSYLRSRLGQCSDAVSATAKAVLGDAVHVSRELVGRAWRHALFLDGSRVAEEVLGLLSAEDRERVLAARVPPGAVR